MCLSNHIQRYRIQRKKRQEERNGLGFHRSSHRPVRTCISLHDWTSDDIICTIDRHREFPSFSRHRNKFSLVDRLIRYSYLPGKYVFTRYRGKKSCQRTVSVGYCVNSVLRRFRTMNSELNRSLTFDFAPRSTDNLAVKWGICFFYRDWHFTDFGKFSLKLNYENGETGAIIF